MRIPGFLILMLSLAGQLGVGIASSLKIAGVYWTISSLYNFLLSICCRILNFSISRMSLIYRLYARTWSSSTNLRSTNLKRALWRLKPKWLLPVPKSSKFIRKPNSVLSQPFGSWSVSTNNFLCSSTTKLGPLLESRIFSPMSKIPRTALFPFNSIVGLTFKSQSTSIAGYLCIRSKPSIGYYNAILRD